MSFDHANIFTILFFLGSAAVVFLTKRNAQRYTIRKIAGIEHIEYGIARAAEAGKPLIFTTGMTSLGPVFFACLSILEAVLHKALKLGVKVLLPQNSPECVAVIEALIADKKKSLGSSTIFYPPELFFLSEEQFAFASGYMGMVHRHAVETAFLFGEFAGESLILSEAGNQIGAFQVAGSVSPEQVPFFICTCDYTLIGEELFAAGAYLGRTSEALASLRAQDILKLVVMIIIIVGALWVTCWGPLPV